MFNLHRLTAQGRAQVARQPVARDVDVRDGRGERRERAGEAIAAL